MSTAATTTTTAPAASAHQIAEPLDPLDAAGASPGATVVDGRAASWTPTVGSSVAVPLKAAITRGGATNQFDGGGGAGGVMDTGCSCGYESQAVVPSEA